MRRQHRKKKPQIAGRTIWRPKGVLAGDEAAATAEPATEEPATAEAETEEPATVVEPATAEEAETEEPATVAEPATAEEAETEEAATVAEPATAEEPPPSELPPSNPARLPLVLLLNPLYHSAEEALSKKFRLLKAFEMKHLTGRPLFLASHETIRVILCSGADSVDAKLIAGLPRLKCIVTTTPDVDHIDVAECRRRGIAVANTSLNRMPFYKDTADYAVGLLIDVLRGLSVADAYTRYGFWLAGFKCRLGSKLGGKKVGIVGMGIVGYQIAKRLKPFGCIISYYSENRKLSVRYPYFSDVCSLAAESDVLVLSCALTDETYHMINKDVLSALGKDGVVINVSRGQLIDEKELVRCLMEREIGGAGLDVFENEPRVPKQLFRMDNVVLSPHRSISTSESSTKLLKIITGNLEAFFSNKPLPSPVTE